MRRAFLWVHFVLSALIVALVFLQAYLITAYVTGAGEDALDAHGLVGFLFIHGAEALVFLTALVAWWRNWTMIGVSLLEDRTSLSSPRRSSALWKRSAVARGVCPSTCTA